MDFFPNNTYKPTEQSNWNLDDGYSLYLNNNVLLNVIPARTGGISYYHRLRLMLHTVDKQFLSCPNFNKKGSFVVRNKYIFFVYNNSCGFSMLFLIKIINEVRPRKQEVQMFLPRK